MFLLLEKYNFGSKVKGTKSQTYNSQSDAKFAMLWSIKNLGINILLQFKHLYSENEILLAVEVVAAVEAEASVEEDAVVTLVEAEPTSLSWRAGWGGRGLYLTDLPHLLIYFERSVLYLG